MKHRLIQRDDPVWQLTHSVSVSRCLCSPETCSFSFSINIVYECSLCPQKLNGVCKSPIQHSHLGLQIYSMNCSLRGYWSPSDDVQRCCGVAWGKYILRSRAYGTCWNYNCRYDAAKKTLNDLNHVPLLSQEIRGLGKQLVEFRNWNQSATFPRTNTALLVV